MGAGCKNNDLLMLALGRFYNDEKHVDKFMEVVSGNGPVSLRLIDFFVTSYSKTHKTSVVTDQDNVVLCVHASYRSQLKAFSKTRFDPFRRGERILFQFADNRTVETTIGQLNAFRWLIQTGTLNYVSNHREEIESAMYKVDKVDKVNMVEKVGNTDKVGTINTDDYNEDDYKNKRKNATCEHNRLRVTEFTQPLRVTFD